MGSVEGGGDGLDHCAEGGVKGQSRSRCTWRMDVKGSQAAVMVMSIACVVGEVQADCSGCASAELTERKTARKVPARMMILVLLGKSTADCNSRFPPASLLMVDSLSGEGVRASRVSGVGAGNESKGERSSGAIVQRDL